MSYFHVFITHSNWPKDKAILRDLSKQELKKRFVKPFLANARINIDGTIITPEAVSELQIAETIESYDKVIADAKGWLSGGAGKPTSGERALILYDDHGKNVTSKYIPLKLSAGSSFRRIVNGIHNYYIAVIVAGLAVMFIWKYCEEFFTNGKNHEAPKIQATASSLLTTDSRAMNLTDAVEPPKEVR